MYKTFDEYWAAIVPDSDSENPHVTQIIALQKGAARSGWNGAMEQMKLFVIERSTIDGGEKDGS